MTKPDDTASADRPSESTIDAHARETALREILKVISASRDDEAPVFEVILTHARALCEVPVGGLVLGQSGDAFLTFGVVHGLEEATVEFFRQGRATMDSKESFSARAILDGKLIHLADMADTDEYRAGYLTVTSMVDLQGIRTVLFVPLISKGQGIGALALFRQEVRPFTDSQITLVETFAEQAVIAIENVRQFRELQTRLERERALKDILDVISQSRDDETPVFNAIVENAARLCGAPHALLMLRNEQDTHLELAAESYAETNAVDYLKAHPYRLDDKDSLSVEVLLSAEVRHIDDVAKHEYSRNPTPMLAMAIKEQSIRTLLNVPLLKDGRAIGLIVVYKQEVAPFDDGEIELVSTFAAQAVIAIDNVRQFRELQTRLEREEATSEVLKVISQSRDDEMPVFRMIQEHAARLCNAPFSGLFMVDETGENLNLVLHAGRESAYVDGGADSVWPLSGISAMARAVVRKKVIKIDSMLETKAYRGGDPQTVRAAELEKISTFLAVPLLSDGHGLGCIGLYRTEPVPFRDDQVELVKTFAAQAVIAINNVKQFKALEQLNAELGDRVEEQVGEIERVGRLKRFLPTAVADTVMSSGSEEMLKSHRAMIATLFCDIRGFTAFCESAEPEETIEVLQTFHETLGKLIDQAGAGFDHRAGDGIMVVFNDPVPCDDPARAALGVAIAMREVMVDLCAKWRKLGHRMGFGVGISLGYATVGMVGFEGRYDYTANGTVVNLASRLCDQAADQEILISQRAATALEDYATVESAGELTLKGFHAPVDVCRVIDVKETL